MNTHKFPGSGEDDILKTFSSLNIDLRNLNPNVIRAWFSTDCEKTKNLLQWLTFSLTEANYLSPLELSEYEEIECKLSSQKCAKEIANLNPAYLTIIDDEEQCDIALLNDQLKLLEQENEELDELINSYELCQNDLSFTFTQTTNEEIRLKVECEQAEKACENICEEMDSLDKELQKTLINFDLNSLVTNNVDIERSCQTVNNLNSFLLSYIELNNPAAADNFENYPPDKLEACRERIVDSHQRYLANKVEIEKLKKISQFLNSVDVNMSLLDYSSAISKADIASKEICKAELCYALDRMVSKIADDYLQKTKIEQVKKELEEQQQKSLQVSLVIDNITNQLAYNALINYFLCEEIKELERINDFCKFIMEYERNNVTRCFNRTLQIKQAIEDYNIYKKKTISEKSKLISSIINVMGSEDSLKSVAACVSELRHELTTLESQIYCPNLKSEMAKLHSRKQHIKILQKFLTSGPTIRVVTIPLKLQMIWIEVAEYLNKTRASILRAVEIPQKAKKLLTKSQHYQKQLWMNFLVSPSEVESVLQQAQEDFEKRVQKYF